MSRTPRTNLRRAGGLATVLVSAAGVAVAMAPSAAGVPVAETVKIGTATSLSVMYRGNGHGHGMSQYGARGAARVGLDYKRIVAFYYPGASLVSTPRRMIRVKLAGTGATTTIVAQPNTTVTGVSGYLPVTGVRRYRLVADARSGLSLLRLPSAAGAKWTTIRTGLPNRAEFHRPSHLPTRVIHTDGTSTDYNGYVSAVRTSGGAVMTVNRVGLDNYVAAVVPREMPASWERAAVDAQAVAARTYASSVIAGVGSGAEYDICATDQCQVYGGRTHYAHDGTVLYSQFAQAALDTSYKILQYKGAPAFTQFSASNGGWSVDGGQPYLVAKADPYDTAQRSLDPYIDVTKKVTVASIARYFGLAKVTAVSITARDGHGTWKGRVLAGSVTGTDSKGAKKVVPADGYDFAGVFGLGTTWLKVLTPAA